MRMCEPCIHTVSAGNYPPTGCSWYPQLLVHSQGVFDCKGCAPNFKPVTLWEQVPRCQKPIPKGLCSHCVGCADIATFCWIFSAPWAGLSLDSYPSLKAWHDKIAARSAVKEGLDVPEPNRLMIALNDPEVMKNLVAEAQTMMVSTKL